MIVHLLLFLIVHEHAASGFQHLLANLPALPSSTGLIGDGTPAEPLGFTNPYTRGSIYGTSFSDRNSIGTGTFSGYGYTPIGAVNGFGAAGEEEMNDSPGFPWGGTAFNYSSPWGDGRHPGPHPMWPKPPSPYGIKENDPRTVGLTSWNNSGVSNFTKYGLGGADSFSPYRQYKYRMGEIPSSGAWRYSGSPGGEPIPFKNPYGTIPSTVPDGMEKSNSVQRRAANGIMPMGSTTDQVRSLGEGVLYPYKNNVDSGVRGGSFLQLKNFNDVQEGSTGRGRERRRGWVGGEKTSAYQSKRLRSHESNQGFGLRDGKPRPRKAEQPGV